MRVGSAYALARAGAASILETGLSDLREEVRRCATWGLCALAAQLATPPLLRGCESDVTSVRKHAAFALGENGQPSAEVCAMLRVLLGFAPDNDCRVILVVDEAQDLQPEFLPMFDILRSAMDRDLGDAVRFACHFAGAQQEEVGRAHFALPCRHPVFI